MYTYVRGVLLHIVYCSNTEAEETSFLVLIPFIEVCIVPAPITGYVLQLCRHGGAAAINYCSLPLDKGTNGSINYRNMT